MGGFKGEGGKGMTRQEQFVARHKKFHRNIALSQVGLFLLFLALWEIAAYVGWIDSFFFCSPSIVVTCFARMLIKEELLMHLGYSLLEISISFVLIFLISFATAILLWYYLALSRILEPFLVVLNSLPKIALGPIIIVWFGAGTKSIVFMAIIITIIVTIITMENGFLSVEKNKIKLLKQP